MKIDLSFEVSDYDFDVIHDVVLDAADKSMDRVALERLVEGLPRDLLLKAFQFGFSDTEVRDHLYWWVEKNNREDRKNE